MTHEEHSGTFAYTYSARQQEEVRRIRDKYTGRQGSKLEQLRRLDQSVTRKGMPAALALGISGCLVLGVGMCCTMVWGGRLFIPGIVIGLAGIAGICLAYPLYGRITRRERERLAPEILRLTEELMEQ